MKEECNSKNIKDIGHFNTTFDIVLNLNMASDEMYNMLELYR
jgi:hypothetical protein